MKTAKELFSKYEILAPSEEDSDVFDQHTDCVDYCGFINAIAEHDKEILSLIDEMILENGYNRGQVILLNELKQKILKEN